MALDPHLEPQAFFDATPCALLQTAENGTFNRVNRTFCKWVGRESHELVGRLRLQDLFTMGGRIFHQTHWEPLLRMQGSISEVKLELQSADGSTLPVVLNAIRYDQAGKIVHEVAAFIARDRDRYEKELVLSRKRLEELVAEATRLRDDAKDRALFAEQMIGIVSHDLRNPLSSIKMAADLLGAAKLPVRERRFASQISRATDRATRLVSDLLDFTQAGLGGGLTVAMKEFDLHEAVRESLEELRLAHPAHAIVQVRQGDGPCTADPDRLEQLVGNLVSNAIAYGMPGTPITVTSATNLNETAVWVHNSGTPIPPDAQAALFQPMTRGNVAGGAARSVGLGLFIVREVAKAHGGDASVVSTAAAGTTFAVKFPRIPPASSAPA